MTSAADKPVATSVMQFSLRAIMVAVTVMALACAVAAPFVRSMGQSQQMRLFAMVAAAAVGAIGSTALMCWRRWQVEERAGAPLLEAPMLSLRSVRTMFVSSLVNSALMLWMMRNALFGSGPWWTLLLVLPLGAAAGFQITMSFLYLWWRRAMVSIVLCENGIVINALRFIPWNELGGSHWSFERGYLCWAARKLYMNGFQLPTELRDQADRIMRERIPDARPPMPERPAARRA